MRHHLTHEPVVCGILRLPGRKAIDISIEHAEGCSNEDRIVDLTISCPLSSCCSDVFGRDVLATLLHFSGDGKQRLKLRRNVGRCDVRLDGFDKSVVGIVSAEVLCCSGTVRKLAETAVVAR